jgi:eukaryotic-like serine/threonine-protein kinase
VAKLLEGAPGRASTTAADVYALGVLLNQFLTGTLLTSIEEQEPVRPSAAETIPAGVRRRLRGDLDYIVLKAVEKDPERRYQSAQELLDDVDRHLAGQTVRARRPT